MKLPIYLDNAATTPLDPRVIEKMVHCMREYYGNPASSHHYGREAAELITLARQQVADLIKAAPREIIWTSGATEAINLALKGAAQANQDKGRHIVTCETEHSAVLDSCAQLEKQGFTVTYLKPAKNGLLDPEQFTAALQADTILASIMHVNNEIGVIQDIATISKETRARGILLHVDAVQSVGKIPIDLMQLNVDLMSFSAHKLYGPKGVGALFVRQHPRVSLAAQIHGGGQQYGLRSGTLATHQIVGMGEAFLLANNLMVEESQRIYRLRDRLWQGIKNLKRVYLNGELQHSVPGILNISIANVDSQQLLNALSDLAIATGSACHANKQQTSHVLRSIGVPDALLNNALRFSLGRFTTEAEVDFAIHKLTEAVKFLGETL